MMFSAIFAVLPFITYALRLNYGISSQVEQSNDQAEVKRMKPGQAFDRTVLQSSLAWPTPATNFENASLPNETSWPEKWAEALERAAAVANVLDEDTLFNFLHAGKGQKMYTAMTQRLEVYNVPSLKMHEAIPGFLARNEDERKRVTSFPSYLALASTFDTDLITEVALAVSAEFKTLGANAILGPPINVHRSTQHDQDYDTLSGEDPTLGAILTRAWIMAVQTHGVMSIPKHFGRVEQDPVHWQNASSNYTVWDVYYPPWQMAVDVGVSGVMCDGHEVNGLWACRDSELLKRDLRGIMEFKGMVVASPGHAHNILNGASSFEKGLDLALDEPSDVIEAARGRLTLIDAADKQRKVKAMRKSVTRVLAAMWHMKDEVNPGCQKEYCREWLARTATNEAHAATAAKAAGSSVVLLKNDGLLPFSSDKVKTLALFGPASLTSWHTYDNLSPYDAISAHAKSFGIAVQNTTDGADACAVMVGNWGPNSQWKLDAPSMTALNGALANPVCKGKLAVLLEVSGAVITPWREQANAIATIFHNHGKTAFGWAATLFPDGRPSAKLPVGFPDFEQEVPAWWTETPPSYWNRMNFAYPFGHGLSYATFKYTEAKQKPACLFPLCVMVTVVNTSPKYSGSEVVQVYFKFPASTHPTVLRSFKKTKVLAPGEATKVFFPFSLRDISLFKEIRGVTVPEDSWVPQRNITVMFGSSSSDIRKVVPVKPKVA